MWIIKLKLKYFLACIRFTNFYKANVFAKNVHVVDICAKDIKSKSSKTLWACPSNHAIKQVLIKKMLK